MADPAAQKLAADLAGQLGALENLSRALGQTNYAELAAQADKLRQANYEVLKGEVERARLLERERALLSGGYLQRMQEEVRLREATARQALGERRAMLESGNTLAQLQTRVRLERELNQLTRQESALSRGVRHDALRSGQYLSDARAAAREQLHDSLSDARERRLQVQAQREQIGTPASVALARANAQERRAREIFQEQQSRLDRRADLEARFGLRGGAIAYGLERFGQHGATRAGFGLATAGATTVFGSAMSGFGGTVEMHRFQLELRLISRELASSLKPALDTATGGLREFRQWLEAMSPTQQKMLMYGTLTVLGLKGLSMASNRLLGMGLLEAGGAVAGRFAASRAASSAAASATAGVAARAGTGAAANVAGGAAGGGLSALGIAALPATLTAGMFKGAYDAATGGYYSHARETTPTHRGRSMPVAAGVAVGASFWDNIAASINHLLPSGSELPRYDERFLPKGGKSSVTLGDAGFEETGSGYDRLSIQLADLTGRRDEDSANLKKIAENTDPDRNRKTGPPEVNR
jgi:hypothetical protein